MKAETPWQAAQSKRYPALKQSVECDVAVIGGGIAGLSAAYLLKQAGKKVCLLERDHLGSGDTGLTSAHLTYVTDLRISELVKTFSEKIAGLVWRGGEVAIDTIESISRAEQIECDFRRVPGFLTAPFDKDGDKSRDLKRDAEQADALGFPARFVKLVPFIQRSGILFPNQAKFHPLKYLSGLANTVHGDGSAIYEQTEVTEVREDRVAANGHDVRAKYVIVATHVPMMGKTPLVSATLFQTKIFPYSSYVIGAKVPKGIVPEACFWDIADPYHYLRVESGPRGDYVIFGGEDHKTGQADDTQEHFDKLKKTLLRMIPRAKPDRQWSGQVIETNDGLPYIGESTEKQFVATGFAGNGMTFGTLSGLMARDAVLGCENPWKDVFAVDRRKIRGSIWNYISENVDFPYYYVRDRLRGAEKSTASTIKPGEGKVIKIDSERVACSRDEKGKLHAVSPYCTHLGCLVHWNQAETTWDCPCHGSRFQATGEVLAGPAETPLEPVKKSEIKARSPSGRKGSRRKKPSASSSKKSAKATGRSGKLQHRNSHGRRKGRRSASRQSR